MALTNAFAVFFCALIAAFKFFSLTFKSLTALSNAFLAFFCSLVSGLFFAPIPAAAETPELMLVELTDAALALVVGTATTPATSEIDAAKATTNRVKRERNFI